MPVVCASVKKCRRNRDSYCFLSFLTFHYILVERLCNGHRDFNKRSDSTMLHSMKCASFLDIRLDTLQLNWVHCPGFVLKVSS